MPDTITNNYITNLILTAHNVWVNICMRKPIRQKLSTTYPYNSTYFDLQFSFSFALKAFKISAEMKNVFDLIFENFISLINFLHATASWCDNKNVNGTNPEWVYTVNLNQQKQNIPRPTFGFIGIIFCLRFVSQQISSQALDGWKNCFLIEWLNLPELGLELFTYQICFNKMKANREILAVMEKRLSCFIVFINKNIESENIELRKLNLNFKLIARSDWALSQKSS